MKPALLLLLLALPAAAADRLSVHVLDGGGLGASEAERVLGVAVDLARELTALTVTPVPGLSRRCADEACLRTRVAEAGAEHGLLLLVTPARRGLMDVEVAWVDGVRQVVERRQVTGVAAAELAGGLRPGVVALVPPFTRKGWGGLVVDEREARVRVDGRMVEPSGPVVPLTAGSHEVDLLLPSGEALLSRALVPEGARLRLELPPEALPRATERAARGKGLRAASYVTFSVGALAVAGSLVAGGLSRRTLREVQPCVGDRRCDTYPQALETHEKADRYARAGNVLLGVGGGLSAVGAGLFVFDLVSTDD